ncbi:hypothetical protein BC628DRAFT_1432401 [Trametes gibbosa]|nr:hypothetical protein BC628DRAFT_1432401 [Trametes gibbosa]
MPSRRQHGRSRSRSPRRRSRSPHPRRSTSRDPPPSQKRDPERDRRDRRRGRSESRSRSRDSRQQSRRDHSRDGRRLSVPASSSDSDDSDHKRRKRRKEKRRKERSGSRERDKKEKKSKREKKDKKKHKGSGAVSHQWGKFGIINETDSSHSSLYNKEQEFRAWLVEERKINPETVSKDQTKKEFARFVEDYNTATLPHEKFYHMEEYERRMAALRAGEYLPPADDSYDPNADLKAHQSTHKRRAVERETYMSKDQLMELRKVQNERIEAGKMKLLGMEVKQNMGVRMDGTMFDG